MLNFKITCYLTVRDQIIALVQSNPDLPCPDLPYTDLPGSLPFPYKVHLQAFSAKQNPDLPGSRIYQGKFLSPNNPGKSGFDCTVYLKNSLSKICN